MNCLVALKLFEITHLHDLTKGVKCHERSQMTLSTELHYTQGAKLCFW